MVFAAAVTCERSIRVLLDDEWIFTVPLLNVSECGVEMTDSEDA